MRGEKFRFDPLLAPELREAAVTLGVRGLEDICDTGENYATNYALCYNALCYWYIGVCSG